MGLYLSPSQNLNIFPPIALKYHGHAERSLQYEGDPLKAHDTVGEARQCPRWYMDFVNSE